MLNLLQIEEREGPLHGLGGLCEEYCERRGCIGSVPCLVDYAARVHAHLAVTC